MKKVFRIAIWLLVIVVALLGTIYLIAWKSPRYYKLSHTITVRDSITPFANYPLIANHPRPYILEGKSFVIIGAEHTRNPQHPQIAEIEKHWKQLKPTVALVEGRLGFLFPGLMDPVSTLGEGGKVSQLARKDGIPLYNWDLSKEDLAMRLKEKFSPEQIALAQILNPYFSQLRFGKPISPEGFVEQCLHRASYVQQTQKFRSVNDVDRSWKRYFPLEPDWRNTSDEQALPGYLADMMNITNDLRNQHLVATMKELAARQERVFLICGSSHAACVAPAFK
ncbi:hypothetical protein [Paraflavitalea pollutisoli]|uniref:hypothetical protein n=1 Tax=Paraflavitalea pollutisoli TaxID=3034143 RepID=UPI0023ED5508|nr:hypothetical protein [Paraflavitalea sp. H1-2-19X]